MPSSCMVRTGELAWHSEERNAEKSWVPSKCCAAAGMASTVSGRNTQPARPASSGERTGSLYST